MKKLLILFSLIFLVSFSLYAETPPTKDNALVIDIKSLGLKRPDDNIVVINNSNLSEFNYYLWGFDEKLKDWLPINFYQGQHFDSSHNNRKIKFSFDDYEVRYVAIGIDVGKIVNYSTSVKHDDLYIKIIDIDSSYSNSEFFSFDDFLKTDIVEIVKLDNVKSDSIFDAILAACVNVFERDNFTIEYQDKTAGTIKGIGKFYVSSNRFNIPFRDDYLIKFDIKDGKYRITVTPCEYFRVSKYLDEHNLIDYAKSVDYDWNEFDKINDGYEKYENDLEDLLEDDLNYTFKKYWAAKRVENIFISNLKSKIAENIKSKNEDW